MITEWTPFRWPAGWKDPSALTLLRGTAINYLLIDKAPEFEPVRARALQDGLQVADPTALPAKISLVKGEWAGVRMGRSPGSGGPASAGPTGVAWVNSNGWAIRLAAALHSETAVWVAATPPENPRITADAYLITLADCAGHGGRWVIALDPGLAAGLAAQRPESLEAWKKLTAAAGFFAAHKSWSAYVPQAIVGVISDYAGEHEFFSGELLNLLARAGQHYRILLKDQVSEASFQGLRAVIYADAEAAPPALRKQILAFVQAGGILIAGPKWGAVADPVLTGEDHPRFALHPLGKGRVALAKDDAADPYLWANDSVVLVSHRHDLVRFWNGGATGSFYTMSPDRKQAIVHLMFYANRGPDSASVRVVGRYRSARILTAEQPVARSVEMVSQKDAVEVHLPQVSQYVALELET
jgi:hypothetical protein